MPDNDYKIHKLWIEAVDFEALILEIPKEEINDKLAYLARENGSITKNFYEDFILANCVANINQLVHHIKQKNLTTEDMLEMRHYVVEEIFKINYSMRPDNLIINKNSVVKLKDKKTLSDGEKLLSDNKSWNSSYYENDDGYENDDESVIDIGNEDKKENKEEETESLSDGVTKRWWSRINKYVAIRKFKKDDMIRILKKHYFHNRSSFQTYIVSICVVDFEDLFSLLDSLGLPNRMSPPELIGEIYDLCLEVNDFFTYSNARKYMDHGNPDSRDEEKNNKKSKMTNHAKKNGLKSKKNTKKFKNVSRQELLRLADTMKLFVIGQDNAINDVVEAIQRASVGLKDPIKPIGSFLFAGRTGCGKSLTGKVLADELIKDKNNLVTIDCSEYSSDHEYAKLIGSPQGYVGYEQGGYLTNAMKENPFSIVVFDEIEKASSKIYDLLLQILEEGRLTDGKGNKVSFKEAIIIMTSNVGVKEINDISKTIGFGDVAKVTESKKGKAIETAIKNKFKPEFINRIDSIVYFNDLSRDDYTKIIDIELYKLNNNLKENNTSYSDINLEFDKTVNGFIYKHGINEELGARPLKRCIEKEIATPLATKILEENIDSGSIKVGVKSNKPVFSTKPDKKLKNNENNENGEQSW